LAFLFHTLQTRTDFLSKKTDNIFANCIFVRIREIFTTNRETWRSERKPGDSRVNHETWQLWICTLSIWVWYAYQMCMIHLWYTPDTSSIADRHIIFMWYALDSMCIKCMIPIWYTYIMC
jgi:hypothetical protein